MTSQIRVRWIALTASIQPTNEQGLSPFDTRIVMAVKLINEQYQNASLTLGELAKQLNVSMWHLARLFKKETGLSVKQYLRDVRMKKAEELLLNTMLSIKQVAVAVGYNHVSDFDHYFKKVHEMNPGEYRRVRVNLIVRDGEQESPIDSK